MPVGLDQPTIANEGGLYTKDVGSAPAYACLFYRQESTGLDPLRDQGAIIQMTSIKPKSNTNGYTFLPGGMLMQWGVTSNSTGNISVLFATNGVDFSATPYSIQVTPFRNSSTNFNASFAVATGFSATGFTILNGSAGASGYAYFWLAIGLYTT